MSKLGKFDELIFHFNFLMKHLFRKTNACVYQFS
jgi:hypothetical protein